MDLFDNGVSENYLVKKDSKGKVRCVKIIYEWNDKSHSYYIKRYTYQYRGKRIDQPIIEVSVGKVNRTAREQTILQYNSNIKAYKDKGYKDIDKDPDEYSEADLCNMLPEFTTDANGFAKHMKAKRIDDVKSSSIEKVKYWYGSRKIDGLRCSFYWDGNKIITASRGGKDYEYSTVHFTKNKKFIEFFKMHPDYILDGELYKHGKSLQQLNSAARMEKNAYDCDWLEYYIYDIMIPNVIFEDRLVILNEISKQLNLGFDPEKTWKENDLQIQMVPQERVTGLSNIDLLHNQYVQEGWEGLVIRDPNKVYKFDGRGNEMIKIKKYKDDCFKVIGIEQGLRHYDDMTFILITPDGKTFKAKPIGDRNQKIDYTDHFEDQYKDKTGECKFFYYSDEGTPLQPVFKAFRYDI